jgi:hypothetical protein
LTQRQDDAFNPNCKPFSRLGVRASLACEGRHLTAHEEALFEQMDRERLTPDERARRIIEMSRASRRQKTPAKA